MEQHPSYQNTQDFAGLTDALIPANTYMNSWSQSNLPKQSDIQPVSLGLDMYPHPFGDVFPLPNISENTLPRSGQITPFNPASVYSASSTQPLELMNLDQNAEVCEAFYPPSYTDHGLDQNGCKPCWHSIPAPDCQNQYRNS